MDLLHQLSWSEFGMAALLALGCWYVVIWAVYYRHGPAGKGEALPRRLPVLDEEEEFEVLGAAEEPEGSSVVPMDGFGFAPRADEELLGLVPDVLEELKQVLHTVESKGGDKADFIALFRLVSPKYERLKLSRHVAAVHDWITDQVPFELSEDELWALWD